MNPLPESALAAEARARVLIDDQLTAAGWVVQCTSNLNLSAAQGVARREAILATGHGRADYLLYLDRRLVGGTEAKPVGTPLSGAEWQSAMYAAGLPAEVRLSVVTRDGRLPFVFEASGTETHFTNGHDAEPRSRTAGPRWCCPTMSSSKAVRARPFGASCSPTSMCTLCCACLPASSTHKA